MKLLLPKITAILVITSICTFVRAQTLSTALSSAAPKATQTAAETANKLYLRISYCTGNKEFGTQYKEVAQLLKKTIEEKLPHFYKVVMRKDSKHTEQFRVVAYRSALKAKRNTDDNKMLWLKKKMTEESPDMVEYRFWSDDQWKVSHWNWAAVRKGANLEFRERFK